MTDIEIVTPLEPHVYIDGEIRNREYPDTFTIPSTEMKAILRRGDFVKIGVEIPEGLGERFWAKITKIEDGEIIAEINNDLLGSELHNLELGDFIQVEPRHVLDILADPTPRKSALPRSSQT